MLLEQVKHHSRPAHDDPEQESKGGQEAHLHSGAAAAHQQPPALGCQNPQTRHLQVALTFFPASAGPAAVRYEVSVSGSLTSGHTTKCLHPGRPPAQQLPQVPSAHVQLQRGRRGSHQRAPGEGVPIRKERINVISMPGKQQISTAAKIK